MGQVLRCLKDVLCLGNKALFLFHTSQSVPHPNISRTHLAPHIVITVLLTIFPMPVIHGFSTYSSNKCDEQESVPSIQASDHHVLRNAAAKEGKGCFRGLYHILVCKQSPRCATQWHAPDAPNKRTKKPTIFS